MRKRIYIETSIPSNYYTLRTSEAALTRKRLTRQWWSTYANRFILTSSATTILELGRGKSAATQNRINLLKSVEMLPITVEIIQIAQTYIGRRIMPQDPTGDALHLAVASFHEVDVILTWNCRHLANPNKLGLILQINREFGLPTPELTTPLDSLGGML